MFGKIELMDMAQAMARHAAQRQNVIAGNVANADTPGYKARDLSSFAESYRADTSLRGTRAGHITEAAARTEARIRTEPGTASPNGNTVSLEDEMVRGLEVKRQHDLALTIYKTSLGILRTSLGRR